MGIMGGLKVGTRQKARVNAQNQLIKLRFIALA